VKIKLDENLPRRLVKSLGRIGHDADTVPQEGLAGSDDSSVWIAAQQSGRFFVTQDLDFSDIRKFRPGSHHGLLLIRLREPSRRTLTGHIVHLFETEDVATWLGCFIVATEYKLRIRRPPVV